MGNVEKIDDFQIALGDLNFFVPAHAFSKCLMIKKHAFWGNVAIGLGSSQEFKHRITIGSLNSTPEYNNTKRMGNRCSNKSSRVNVYSSTIRRGQKVQKTQRPATGEWITNKRYIHIVEYYLALKRSEVLTPVTTQMHLENVTLSDLSQMQKVT